ncbi:MAG: PAS domain S-box protein [Theionarchaea archaeon]|nr:PAS domain S-box protein [Theionarchaea archaeon]
MPTKTLGTDTEKVMIERVLQSESFSEAVELFLEATARLSGAISLGFYAVHPEGINLVSYKGKEPTGNLSLKVQEKSSRHSSVIKGLEAAFPLVFSEKIFGILELTYITPPSPDELDSIESLCRDTAAALGAVRTYDTYKSKVEETIAELTHMEKALQESEEKYRSLVERANDGIAIIQDTLFKYVNPRLAEIGNSTVEALVGTPFTDYIYPDELPKVVGFYEMRMAGENINPVYETVIVREDGSPVQVEINAGITTYKGRPADLVIVRDITERKKMEADLHKSEEEFRNLFELAPDAILTLNLEGTITSCNTAAAVMTGYSKDEIVGLHISKLKFLQKKDIPLHLQSLSSLVQGESAELPEITWIHKDGTVHVSEARVQPVKERGKVVRLLVISRDITEHKKAEEALKESEEKYRTLIENLNVGVYRVTPGKGGHFLDVNPAFVQMLGYRDKKEILTLKASDIYVNPEDRIRFSEKVSLHGFVRNEELTLKKKDGTPIIVSDTSTAVYNSNGTLLYLDGITEDITQRKKAEEQIKASLKEKEVLLREIHHRVKNNMQIISSLLNLQSKCTEDRQLITAFKESQDRIRSMSLIHEKLYQSRDLARIDFDEYTRSLIDNLFHSYRIDTKKITPIIDVEGVSLGVDIAIPCGLIINELVSNCLKHAFPDGKGNVRIALHSTSKNEIELAVIDNGVGIPGDIDFGTTKTLGLSLVSILAEDQLNGKIRIDRVKGTAFYITFTVI